MSELAEISIGELARGIRGVTYKPYQLKEDVGLNDYYLLRSNNIQNGTVDFNDMQIVEKSCVSEKQKLIDGDIIVCMSNGSRPLVGKSALINSLQGNYCVGSFCSSFRANLGVNPNFVFQIFRSVNFKFGIDVILSGSAINNLQNKHIEELKFIIPASIEEQNQIVSILSKADVAITQTEALIAKYQRIKTGLVQDLLTKGIDEHGNIRNEKNHRFKTEKGFRVPEEWAVYEIGEITDHVGSGVTPKGGSNVYVHEGILLIRSQNVLVGEFDLDDVAYITSEINNRMQRSELQDLDVLLNITGASIGRSHFVPLNFPKSNVNQHVCALRIKNSSLGKSLFVSSFLNSYEGQKQIKRLLGASNREGLNYQQIREIKLSMPKIEEDADYQKIYYVLTSINTKIETLKNNLKKQKSLKTGLMQDLLSGKVRVKIKKELT